MGIIVTLHCQGECVTIFIEVNVKKMSCPCHKTGYQRNAKVNSYPGNATFMSQRFFVETYK